MTQLQERVEDKTHPTNIQVIQVDRLLREFWKRCDETVAKVYLQLRPHRVFLLKIQSVVGEGKWPEKVDAMVAIDSLTYFDEVARG